MIEKNADKEERLAEQNCPTGDAALEPEGIIPIIQRLSETVAGKSQRTVLPKALNRFPINRLGFLSRWILRCYEYVFRDQREANYAIISMFQTLAHEVSDLQREITELRSEQQRGITELKSEWSREVSDVRREITDLKSEQQRGITELRSEQQRGITELKSEWSREVSGLQREITDLKYTTLEQHRRLTLLSEDARERIPNSARARQAESSMTFRDHALDGMYVSLEDRFRGTREDIKERQRKYLPYLADTAVGMDGGLVVDLGCGRGEWLEVLKENGYPAKGVDTNAVTIELCLQQDLEVIEADAIDFLRHQKSETVGVITSFHLIEHLGFESLMSLLDESLRILRSGGLIILESPNPENIQVGACNFYLDPTHRRPIPPPTAAFLLETRGFVRVEILKIHAADETCHIPANDNPFATRFNHLFYGPMDYAVIARKA